MSILDDLKLISDKNLNINNDIVNIIIDVNEAKLDIECIDNIKVPTENEINIQILNLMISKLICSLQNRDDEESFEYIKKSISYLVNKITSNFS